MPVTIKVSQIKYKDNNGNYVGINGVAEQSTQEEIAAIEAAGSTVETAIETKGAQTIASIPADYTALCDEVVNLKSALSDNIINATLVPGSINSQGVEETTNLGLRSNAIIDIYEDMEFVVSSGWAIMLYYYTPDSHTFIRQDGWFVGPQILKIPKGRQIRFVVSTRPSVSDISALAGNMLIGFNVRLYNPKRIQNVETELFNDLTANRTHIPMDLELGGIITQTGKADNTNTYVIRSKDFLVAEQDISIIVNDGYHMSIYYYYNDNYYTYKEYVNIVTNTVYTIPKGSVYKVVFYYYPSGGSLTSLFSTSDWYYESHSIMHIALVDLGDAYELGGISNTGADETNQYCVRSEETITAEHNVTVKVCLGYELIVFWYSASGDFIRKSGWIHAGESIKIHYGDVFRMQIAAVPLKTLSSVNEIVEPYKAFKDDSSEKSEKKIWWCGTSIPAGFPNPNTNTPYPERAGQNLGCAVYNVAVPSSSICSKHPSFVSEANPRGFITTNWEEAIIGLDNSEDDITWLVNHHADLTWSSANPGIPSDLDSRKDYYIDYYTQHYSYESLLVPYIGQCDLYVFDHGRNDVAKMTNAQVFDFDAIKAIDEDSSDRTNIIGAMNHLIGLIYANNPKARIIMITNYTDDDIRPYVARCCEVQEVIASKMHIPIVKLYEYTGFNTKTVGNTTVFESWMPDGGHPGSDTTGECNQYLADTLSELIKVYLR